MGSRGTYWRTAGFSSYTEADLEWRTVGTLDGIKILKQPDKPNGSLPEFAKTSEAYIGETKEGKLMTLRVYDKSGFPTLEFDLGHPHHHGLPEGTVHVHKYTKGPDGNPLRDPVGKEPNDKQWEKWGSFIQAMKRRNEQ